jgi:uncharacterized protein YukE
MALTMGMDPGQVHALAGQMRQSAGEIEAIISKLTGMLQGTAWIGQDRAQFEGEWNGTYTSQLRNVAEALNTAAQRADAEATQQEQASS